MSIPAGGTALDIGCPSSAVPRWWVASNDVFHCYQCKDSSTLTWVISQDSQMSSVCSYSSEVPRETTAAYWPCSASTNESCCNWGSAPGELSSKDHSSSTTSESSVCTTCFNLPVAQVGLSSPHYSVFEASRWEMTSYFRSISGPVRPILAGRHL